MKKILFFFTVIVLFLNACTKEDDTASGDETTDNRISAISKIYKGTLEEGDTLADLASYLDNSADITFTLLSQTPTDVIQLTEKGLIIATADAAINLSEDTVVQGKVRVTSPSESYDISIQLLLTNQEVFISHWQLDGSYEVQLPLYDGIGDDPTEYDFDVDWGDGTVDHISSSTDPNAKHTYITDGAKTISIIGKLKGFNFYANAHSKDLITDISAWGDVLIGNKGAYFFNCDNLHTFSATDAPDLSQTTNLTACFYGANNFNGDIGHWDVSTITRMRELFWYNYVFNQDLSSWDVSNVKDMEAMFSGTYVFNQDLSSWDVSNVKDMESMFSGTGVFNQDLSSWDVSSVVDMSSMFASTSVFNGDLSGWDVSSVTDMSSMFFNARAFNSDLSGWDVSNVTDMSSMFSNAYVFNQDLSSWDVSNVTNMNSMFSYASMFNGDLSTWNVGNVTDMGFMFNFARFYNANISGWDVSNVIDMERMFYSAYNFNQNLSQWNTTRVSQCSGFSYLSKIPLIHLPTLGSCFGNVE